jgi:hypothetical protein
VVAIDPVTFKCENQPLFMYSFRVDNEGMVKDELGPKIMEFVVKGYV